MKKRTYSILIIDDAFFLRNLIKKAIAKKPNEDLNYDFEILTEAQNGEEGLELYQIVNPDIVTVDINMPKLNGIEFIKKLKKLNPYSKIIVISSNLASEYKDKVIEAGAFSYIQKPFQDAYLWSRLDAIAEELEKENFNISKFSSDKNYSNVAIPSIKNNKTKTNSQSNKKNNNKKIEEGADLFSSIVADGEITENIKNINNSHKNKKRENKSYQNKDNKNIQKKDKEENEDSFSFLDSLIIKDNSNKKEDINKNINNKKINNNKKDYVHKKEEKKKSFEKVNKPLNKNESLETKKNKDKINNSTDISSKKIVNESDITKIISKKTDIKIVKVNVEENKNNDSILKADFSITDNSKSVENNQKDKLLENIIVDNNSENIILDNNNDNEIINDNEELLIDDNEELLIDDNESIVIDNNESIVIDNNEEVVINDNESIVIDDNEEIVIDNNEEVVIDDNESIVIDDNEEVVISDDEEIIIEEDDSSIIIDDNEELVLEKEINSTNEFEDKSLLNINLNKTNNTYSEDVNSENYLEENITYNIDEFIMPSEIEFNTESQEEIKYETIQLEDESDVNEKEVQTIDYRSPFSSGNVEFILSSETDEHSADIMHEKSYKKENENISYNYNNSSNINNTPKITPPVNNKYKEIYNEKMEREYNVSFDEIEKEEPKEEKKLGFFARLFGGRKKKKDKKIK